MISRSPAYHTDRLPGDPVCLGSVSNVNFSVGKETRNLRVLFRRWKLLLSGLYVRLSRSSCARGTEARGTVNPTNELLVLTTGLDDFLLRDVRSVSTENVGPRNSVLRERSQPNNLGHVQESPDSPILRNSSPLPAKQGRPHCFLPSFSSD